MNRAKLGIGGLAGILAGLLMLGAANIRPFSTPALEDRNESVLVVLGYEPGNYLGYQQKIQSAAVPVLADCPGVTKTRSSTV